MVFLLAFVSLIALVVLHELGHFLVAKKFNVKVEEFGIGLPPRIFGKHIGETLYSLNALPLGAFVRLQGEEKASDDPRSFNRKPMWQRMAIVAAGVVAFWLIAVVIFTVLAPTTGIPTAVPDESTQQVSQAKVQIIAIAQDSPAKKAGLVLGDIILNFQKVGDVQTFVEQNKGKDVLFTIQRGNETLDVLLEARTNPPAGEGPLGVGLVRTAQVRYSWLEAPVQGFERTIGVTKEVVLGLFQVGSSFFKGKGLPEGADVMGPIGILDVLRNSFSLGIGHFLSFLAMLSVYLAVFNILPIPVVDGGKLVFLGIEAVRKKPLNEKLEQGISGFFFLLLIGLLILVTIKDVIQLWP